MALTINLNLAPTSSAEFSGNAYQAINVGGSAWGLSSDESATQWSAFYAILDAIKAQHGLTLFPTGSKHPYNPNLVLTNILMRGLSFDSAEFLMRFETPSGFAPTALILDVDSGLQSVQRDKYPGTQKPIWVGWEGRAVDNGAAQPKSPRIPLDTAPFSYLRPIVRVSAFLVKAGVLNETTSAINAGIIGTVNDRTWVGRPAGCWLMSGYKSSSSRYGGFYSVRAEAIAKGGPNEPFEDWRVLDVLRDRTTGRIAVPNPSYIDSAMSATYKFGNIGSGDQFTQGFVVHGPHRMVNFSDLWSVLIQ